jgi:transposase
VGLDRACFITAETEPERRTADRAQGILFVLRSAIPWEMLPQEVGCGSGMTCCMRLRGWQAEEIWNLIHFALLDWLSGVSRLDWSKVMLDSCSVRAVFGGSAAARTPPIARVAVHQGDTRFLVRLLAILL